MSDNAFAFLAFAFCAVLSLFLTHIPHPQETAEVFALLAIGAALVRL